MSYSSLPILDDNDAGIIREKSEACENESTSLAECSASTKKFCSENPKNSPSKTYALLFAEEIILSESKMTR